MPSADGADRERQDLDHDGSTLPQDHGPGAGPSDVFLDVPALHVDELDLEVEDLEAHVSLQAEVLDLLKLNVGADVRLGRVKLDIEGVDVQAQLKVRLHHIAAIVTRLLATVDRNPEILEQLTRGAGAAVENVGSGAGRAVGQLGEGAGAAVSDVGRAAGAAVESVGESTGTAVEGVGEGAGDAVEDVGRSGAGAVEAVRDGVGEELGDEAQKPRRPSARRRAGASEHGSTKRSTTGDARKRAQGEKSAARATTASDGPAEGASGRKAAVKKASSAKPAAKKAGSVAKRSTGGKAGRAAGEGHRPRRGT
ncbi:hypothetical protein [Streptomyces sp. NPDC005752]|uniref:hypothetical protein n=1 Tax=Streptomyces sp. NPDC005752 TaxID=3157065 RepID=UPI0033C3ABA7